MGHTKKATTVLVPQEVVESRILLIKGKKVMLDRDLAELYGVKPIRLREQVKRNKRRFPDDFMFQLNNQETKELIANCDRFKTIKHSSFNPYKKVWRN
ncbi:MAG: ORF6N domain-containing protein [Candidatus Omnitrophica bacterium]|nr:ORF6N domain-containing protein [Candidatus Omnitrophota bacterium]MBU0896849.1 ORF6N domain-containing protein [Candidatus Omnitrophota bacterium]MBU1134167.1 ORF6N domain-containing protein [Candidatus Omnitrophota bacterium]MBU1367686.1 ORF6N domain-containing protein [Candidatus Omnitrophota bacterium]MBU1523919.1 ORF6N domain-containing protein [Candidatus Omnitrophota bacterium]